MPNQRIASISLADLRPIGRPADRDFHRITGYLASHRAFGTAYSCLFAEPEFLSDDDVADWYWNDIATSAVDEPIAVTNLAPEEQKRILALVTAKLASIQTHAKTLQALRDPMGDALMIATTLPEPLSKYVYWIASASAPEGGYGVLVAWGWVNQNGRLEARDIEGVRPHTPLPPEPAGELDTDVAEPRSQAAPYPATPKEGEKYSERDHPVQPPARSITTIVHEVEVRKTSASFSASWPLWLVFVLLLGVIGWILLRACGLSLTPLQVSFCPVVAQSLETDRVRVLTDLSRDLQLRLAQRDATCVPQQSTQPETPTPPSNIEQRLRESGARTGEVQVSLTWNGEADLDLSVVCPDGSIIFFENRESCGGRLDVDMNAGAQSSMNPVENVFWPDNAAPKGTYRIRVTLFERRGDRRSEIPFEIRIKNGNDVRTIPGRAGPAIKSPISVAEFDR